MRETEEWWSSDPPTVRTSTRETHDLEELFREKRDLNQQSQRLPVGLSVESLSGHFEVGCAGTGGTDGEE